MRPFSLAVVPTEEDQAKRWKASVVDNPTAGQQESPPLPFGFAPGLDDALRAASEQEGGRYLSRVASEQPYREEVPGIFGLGGGPSQLVMPPKYNYDASNLESGRNIDTGSFVKAYDDRERALNASPLRSELGEDMPLDTSASAFIKPTESQLYDRNTRGLDTLGPMLMSLYGPLGSALAVHGAYESGKDLKGAIESGDTQKALFGVGGMALNLAGVAPGLPGKSFAREATAANFGDRLPVLTRDGVPAYRFTTREVGGESVPTWQPATYSPGAQINTFGGPSAKTADLAALSKAEKLAESGAPREQILKETGWFQGADNKWRFEIPDNTASVNLKPEMYGTRVVANRVGMALDHPELYAAYPNIADIKLSQTGKPGGGVYYPTQGLINIGPSDAARTKQTMLHEVQHAIQDKEGFASGASTEDFTYQNSPLFKSRKIYETPDEAYKRVSGEVEARNVEDRIPMSTDERRAVHPSTTEDVPRDKQIIRFGSLGPQESFVGVPPGPMRDRAFQMKMEGASNRDIHAETGYVFGPEGALKREISDVGATVNTDNYKPGFSGTYGDIINHPEVYNAVPGLKDRPVKVSTGNFRSNASGPEALLNAGTPDWTPKWGKADALGLMQYDAAKIGNFAAGNGYLGGGQQLSNTIIQLEKMQRQFSKFGASEEARNGVDNYLRYLNDVRSDYARGLTTSDPAQSELLAASRSPRDHLPESGRLNKALDKGIYNLSAGGYEKRIAKQRVDTPQSELGYPYEPGQLNNEPPFEKMVVLPNNTAANSPIDLLNFAINWHKNRGTR